MIPDIQYRRTGEGTQQKTSGIDALQDSSASLLIISVQTLYSDICAYVL